MVDDTLITHRALSPNRGEQDRRPQKNKRKSQLRNPLQRAISNFMKQEHAETLIADRGLSTEELCALLPKRYNVYAPLLLLPYNFFTTPTAWKDLFESLNDLQRNKLYEAIVSSFAGNGVTHLAQNAPIGAVDSAGTENRMRSPSGLIPLFGDFGDIHRANQSGETPCLTSNPSRLELDKTLWAKSTQNGGIVQTWAPLYTMFSKGNVSEKARILGIQSHFDGLNDHELMPERVQDIAVVDLYAGIGYFVFSYLKRGVKRVWGWEINGWSVEGLRRGCAENGWGCKVVCVQSDGTPDEGFDALVNSLDDSHRVVIFHGDNMLAHRVLTSLKPKMKGKGQWASIRHVNLGLLPTSSLTWDAAVQILDHVHGGWVHVHENVDINEIDVKRDEILQHFKMVGTVNESTTPSLSVKCPHVELVKTYAPGVVHCVFDMEVDFRQG